MQRHDQYFLPMGLLSQPYQTTQYTYVEGPPPLYISCAKQDRYQKILEAAGDKRIKKGNKSK